MISLWAFVRRLRRCWPGGERSTKPAQIELVGLSTTLATNAIVEGHGGRVCLLLLGYDPDLVQKYGFTQDLVTGCSLYPRRT